MIKQELIENPEFDYEDEEVVDHILNKVKDFVEETEWKRMSNLEKEFHFFEQNPGKSNDAYLTRFGIIQIKLKYEKNQLPDKFMAVVFS